MQGTNSTIAAKSNKTHSPIATVVSHSPTGQMPPAPKPHRLIRRKEVLARVGGINRGTLQKWLNAGSFPAPVTVDVKLVLWLEADVDWWIAARSIS